MTDPRVFCDCASSFNFEKPVEVRVQQRTDDRFADIFVPQGWKEVLEVERRAPQEHVQQQNDEFVADVIVSQNLKECFRR